MIDIPNGYKQTEVGVIPEDWDVGSLRYLICSLDAGVSVNSVEKDKDLFAHDESILKTSCVLGGKFLPEEHKQILPHDIHRAKLNPRKDSIIFSRMNTPALVGECGYVDRDYPNLFMPDRLWMAKLAGSYPASARWLAYLLSFSSFNRVIKDTATGTSGSMKNISKRSLLSVLVPLPTKAEQESIAEALSDADALIESLEQLITKKRHIKQGAMQELLTGKKRLPGFQPVGAIHELPLQNVPHGWEVKRLENIAEMGSGGTPPSSVPAYYDGDIPWVSISDMTKGGKIILSTDRCLTREGFSRSAAQMFSNGTVLYAMYASLGECSIAGISLCTSQAILGIRPKENLNNEFLYYYLTLLKTAVKSMGQQGTQANLNKGMVQAFQLWLPPLPEQTAIAAILSDMDAEIATLETKLTKTRQIKQGMMQELLTGRIRLA